ncbi:MAG: sulfatase [Planctomycetota bacterium]|nr:sulfatase [Planctomycetota bacterium]
MRHRTFCLALYLVVVGAGVARAATGEPNRRPGFVFFLVDDLGWTDLSCSGSSFYETPGVDGLARTGLRFTNAYAACPVCSPTRSSILTGKYPTRTGITDYINPPGRNQPDGWRRNTKLLPAAYRDRLAHEEVTVAEALKEAGYATFFAGKWHLGPEGFWPEDQGFDINRGGCERGGPYGGKKYFSPYGNPRLEDGPTGEHLPDRLATETCEFLEANRARPFFAYLSFYSVHTPLMARKDLKEKYQKKAEGVDPTRTVWGREGERKVRLVQKHAVYGGMVEAMDQAVSKVLEKLRELHLDSQTAVFFMSDNGGLSTSEGHPTSNLPLRGGKGWLYEGGIREPMIIRWPGVTRPGSTCSVPVTSTDFYPTILEIAGLPPRPRQHVDGKSLVPLLKGGGLWRGALFWHYPHYGNQGGSPGVAIREGDWKLIEWYEDGRLELFHLGDDIGERRNLVEKQPGRARQLHERLKRWRRETGARMPTPNPRFRKARR